MSNYVGIGTNAPSSTTLMTLTDATTRVASLLRRNDISGEIQQWLNFVLREVTDKIDFPELRVVGTPIPLIPFNSSQTTTTMTGNTTINGNNITNLSSNPITAGLFVGEGITGTGIPGGASIVSMTATTITMSANASATQTGVTLTFGGMQSAVQAAQSYIYPFSVTNFSHMSSIYYTDLTLSPTRGWNLQPFPREFWKGDTIDFERILNRGFPGVGDPLYYFIDKSTGININGTLTTGGYNIIVFPAFITPKVGTITPTYYRLPADWTSPTQQPDIDVRWRHYLIYLTYYWGIMFLEKDDMSKIAYWQSKYDDTIANLREKVMRTENRTEVYNLPTIGLDYADRKY